RIGLVEYAWQELEDVVQRSVGDTVRLYGLTSAYVQEERYHLALRILRRHFAALAVADHASLPPAFWQMLYPLGWRSHLTEAAVREGLDPFFVAAVVREESSYYPRAVSRAGARGLMQLMPRTAEVVAAGGGLSYTGTDALDEPVLNLQLGTKFLGDLMKDFGDPRLAPAAYNAGPRRVPARAENAPDPGEGGGGRRRGGGGATASATRSPASTSSASCCPGTSTDGSTASAELQEFLPPEVGQQRREKQHEGDHEERLSDEHQDGEDDRRRVDQ